MRTPRAFLFIAALMALPTVSATANAQRVPKPRVRAPQTASNHRARPFQRQQSSQRMSAEERAKAQRKLDLATARRIHKEKTEGRQLNARFFKKITQARDYTGEYVISRNQHVTAFLDMSDPMHPRFDPKAKANEEEMMKDIPKAKRVHILVIPNKHQEHISDRLNGHITPDSMRRAQRVMAEAEKLAKSLGVKNPKIWINSENRISIGYLHVHIVGERGQSYPGPMSAASL